MKPSLERVKQALDAINARTGTHKDHMVLQAVGGTAFRGGQFVLALSMDEVARKIGEPPGNITRRITTDIVLAPADPSHTSMRGTRRAKLEGIIGALHIGPRGKLKHRKAR